MSISGTCFSPVGCWGWRADVIVLQRGSPERLHPAATAGVTHSLGVMSSPVSVPCCCIAKDGWFGMLLPGFSKESCFISARRGRDKIQWITSWKLKCQGRFSIHSGWNWISDTLWYQGPHYRMKMRLESVITSLRTVCRPQRFSPSPWVRAE